MPPSNSRASSRSGVRAAARTSGRKTAAPAAAVKATPARKKDKARTPVAFAGRTRTAVKKDTAPQVTVPVQREDGLPVGLFYFDAQWYQETYPDIAEAGVDPVTHFLECGWIEGRNPNALFDSQAYLAVNPDVAGAQLNPFLHFIMYGATEGRKLRPETDDE